MGNYLNPGNSGFAMIRNGNYVDKSGMIGLINRTINTPEQLTCISRPRRFGKSFAAQMLCAYYDRSCDSAVLFGDLEAAAYMTGILPVKKDGSQSAVSDFQEYSVIQPMEFANLKRFKNVPRCGGDF